MKCLLQVVVHELESQADVLIRLMATDTMVLHVGQELQTRPAGKRVQGAGKRRGKDKDKDQDVKVRPWRFT